MIPQQHLIVFLVKLAVAASLASVLARSSTFVRMLLREERTLQQRLRLAAIFAAIFGAGVAARVLTNNAYSAFDLGLEGSLLAGMLGGYVTGLSAGLVISLPAMGSEFLTAPLFAGVGVLGGVLRDIAPSADALWRFTPFFDTAIYRLFRRKYALRDTLFQLVIVVIVLFSEALRWSLDQVFGSNLIFSFHSLFRGAGALETFAIFGAVFFATALPLKIWSNSRNEKLLEAQRQSLTEARLRALASQINPHFLFNTLNSVSSLIRTNPEQARNVVYKLSNILRRLLRKTGNLTPLREELSFIDDYLAIEMVRFGDKLKFEKDIAPETLDMLAPAMMLQPIVENSIKHGLSGKIEGGTIRVRSRVELGRLKITVEDDGAGIPEGKLASLFSGGFDGGYEANADGNEEFGSGIGVSNVNERLKVLFNGDYRMYVDSKPGEGTRTEIEFPSGQLGSAMSYNKPSAWKHD